jgi:hypothetical protein
MPLRAGTRAYGRTVKGLGLGRSSRASCQLESTSAPRRPGTNAAVGWWNLRLAYPSFNFAKLRTNDLPQLHRAGAASDPLERSSSMSTRRCVAGLLVLVSLGLCGGCASSSVSRRDPAPLAEGDTRSRTAVNPHPGIYTNIPRHHFTTTQKLNPAFWFGNADDPVPPASYRPDDPHRNRKWYWRNSCHNFTFYVMGIGDKEFVRVGRYAGKVFNPEGGWNWAVCKHYCLRLPFVSYQRGGFKFYIGWRQRGNFGIKLNF